MGQFYFKKEWLPILISHEKDLVFSSFKRKDAFDIGVDIVKLAKEKYKGNISVCIYEEDMLIFSHKMQGTNIENDKWMFRKMNVSKAMGMSSIRALVEIERGLCDASWSDNDNSFIACGGCYLVNVEDNEPYILILVSGLEHYLDHQIIVDAVSGKLNITLPSISF